MSYFFKDDKPTPVDSQIEAILLEMQSSGVTSTEYQLLLENLERLNDIKAKQGRDRISRDTLAIIGANLLGILVIVGYEHAHVMTSKALTHIIKPK